MPANLDSNSTYQNLDPSGMRFRLRQFPNQCQDAWEQALELHLPARYARCSLVVVLGMGGSAIGGDLLADLAFPEENAPPVLVVRGYTLPGYVDEDALVLACSYSGETQETLSTFRQALERRARAIAVTSGGTLASEAKTDGIPLFTIDFQGEPRSALGYLFLAPLAFMQRLGLVSDKNPDVEQAVSELRSLVSHINEDVPTISNESKNLANSLFGRLPVVYGAGLFSSVAKRWKTQFNENAKVWAFSEQLPELHHNSVVGYPLPDAVKKLATVLMLKPQTLDRDTAHRYEITEKLLTNEGINYHLIQDRSGSPLTQMLTTTLLGDYTSYYLGLLNGVNPSAVQVIDLLKSMLR